MRKASSGELQRDPAGCHPRTDSVSFQSVMSRKLRRVDDLGGSLPAGPGLRPAAAYTRPQSRRGTRFRQTTRAEMLATAATITQNAGEASLPVEPSSHCATSGVNPPKIATPML